jgi:serine/threonine protein kinase
MSTDEEVAIKTVSWRCIRACQNRLSEDFVKEISALQYLSKWRADEGKSITDIHVITADTVMCDECCLYIVMPFCRGGDLCQRVAEVEKFTEDESRLWFRQILKVRCLIITICSLNLTIDLVY